MSLKNQMMQAIRLPPKMRSAKSGHKPSIALRIEKSFTISSPNLNKENSTLALAEVRKGEYNLG